VLPAARCVRPRLHVKASHLEDNHFVASKYCNDATFFNGVEIIPQPDKPEPTVQSYCILKHQRAGCPLGAGRQAEIRLLRLGRYVLTVTLSLVPLPLHLLAGPDRFP
jgi:hypothetical protein